MKILQVIDTLDIGGAEKVLVVLSNILHRKGQDVGVLTLLEPGILAKELLPDISIFPLKRRWKFNPETMWQFVRIAKNYDIIHVHSSHNLRYIWLACRIFNLKKPIIFHEHFGNIETDETVHWHQRIIYPSVILIGVSASICYWAEHKVGVPKERVHLMRNIVPRHPSSEYQVKNTNKKVSLVVTANIRRPKNIGFAIEVFAAYSKKYPSNLTIIGQVAEPDYYRELVELCQKLGQEENIQFIHNCSNIQPILHQFDAALHTPVSESGPLVLIEYAAQGLPFLSYNTGEIARLVSATFPSLVLDHFNIPSWVESLEQLLKQGREHWGQSLQQFHQKEFSEDSYYEQCIKIYQSALRS